MSPVQTKWRNERVSTRVCDQHPGACAERLGCVEGGGMGFFFFFKYLLFIQLHWVLVGHTGSLVAAFRLLVVACGTSSLTRDQT